MYAIEMVGRIKIAHDLDDGEYKMCVFGDRLGELTLF